MPGKLYAFLKITDIRLPSATWIFITVLTIEIGGGLGSRYNLTESALRKMVKRVQDRIIKEKQLDMFI